MSYWMRLITQILQFFCKEAYRVNIQQYSNTQKRTGENNEKLTRELTITW